MQQALVCAQIGHGLWQVWITQAAPTEGGASFMNKPLTDEALQQCGHCLCHFDGIPALRQPVVLCL